MATHENSRVITIFRKNSFIAQAQEGSAPEFLSESRRSIGSYWKDSHSVAVGTGLTFKEQELLLPELVDCEPTDRNFRNKVKEYYQNIRTSVPYGTGVKLEIGLQKDNTLPVSESNMPIDLSNYLAYRHALGSPEVAPSLKEANGHIIQYYIFDPMADELENIAKNKHRDSALEKYLLVSKDANKVKMFLTLLNVDIRKKELSGVNAEGLRVEELKKLLDADPAKFLEIHEEKFFEEHYVIQSMINYKILTRVGEMIIDKEGGRTIGHNMDEAIVWLRTPENSESLLILKAKLQEATGEKAETPAVNKAL